MRFTLTTMGANQYATTKERSIYFNWYFFSLYASAITASTAIVYVEDNVSWAWGFGLCAAANALGLAIFLFGSRFYRHVKPEGSPFTSLVRVLVASIRKRKAQISLKSDDYYRGGHDNGIQKLAAATPTTSFSLWSGSWMVGGLEMRVESPPSGPITYYIPPAGGWVRLYTKVWSAICSGVQ
ncbi:hypothetical protein RHSIM_Rhsim13G0091200 [Rhododendron simsii]|uniref:Uncharacterized protein n=1 Tax=Rhododendron simsii TaxID=118357 RepID=A0A834L6P2_RHOSS|nr:hypothetical protein RHSIM_Rhsim13G0091200 [Rhododendron simsii]